MRQLFFPTLLMLLILISSSCNEEAIESQTEKQEKQTSSVILKERDPNSPLVLSQKRSLQREVTLKSAADEPFKNILGKSLKATMIPLTNYNNFGWSVLDMDNYLEDYPNCYYNLPIGTTVSKSFAYTNFNEYVKNMKITVKVKTSLKLSFLKFKSGAETTIESTFGYSTTNENNRVFGELHYQYEASKYWLKTTTYDIKNMQRYLSKSFKNDLYNITPNELLDTYGRFVMTDFIVGGKAVALYSGVYQGNASSSSKQRSMKIDINASFGKTVSGGFGIGTTYAGDKQSSNKFTDLMTSVKTLGGIGAIINYTDPTDVNSVNIDLSDWLSSLSDNSNHRVIDISDDGLLPLLDFIKEDNLKLRITYMLNRPNFNFNFDFVEPTLVYVYDYDGSDKELIYLVTRFGDAILLYFEDYVDADYTNNLINQYSDKYKIRTVDCSDWYNIFAPMPDDPENSLYLEYDYVSQGFIGINMKKLISNGTIYLISQKAGVKFAFSINNDYILDTYGIRNWIDQMQTSQLTEEQLYHAYTIVGL